MQRSLLLRTAWLTMVIVWGGPLLGDDAPVQREDIGRALEMYHWLVDHEEFSAAGKLAAELQAIHPDDPQVQLIVENAQLRAAVREANRVLVEEEAAITTDTVPAVQPEVIPTPGSSADDPFDPPVDWENHVLLPQEPEPPTAPVPPGEPRIIQTAGAPEQPRDPEHAAEDSIDPVRNWIEIARRRHTTGSTPTQQEVRVQNALSEPISLHFDEAPLAELLRHISQACNINMVVDATGLQEEGLTPDVPVTINVDGVMLESALNVLLKPRGLDFMVEDEVLKITSHTRRLGRLTTRVYAVADLVTPIPHRTPGNVRDKLEEMTAPATSEFEWVEDLITTTVQPDSWSTAGGEAVIQRHEGTLSLVIRQTESAHEEIGELLRQLRELRGMEVAHAVHLLNVPIADLGELGLTDDTGVHVVTAEEKSQYMSHVFGEDSTFEIEGLPGITLFNCQTGTIAGGDRVMLISSVVSADRRTVRLNVAAPESLDVGDVMSAVHSVVVPDGSIALVLISDAAHLMTAEGRVEVLAITPRIEVLEEEEEEALLGAP